MTAKQIRLTLVRITQYMNAVLKQKAANDETVLTTFIDEDLGK